MKTNALPRAAVLAAAACLATIALLMAWPGVSARAAQGSALVQQVPVSFTVSNTNTSRVPCLTDGRTYTIAGTLFLPAGPMPQGVTLYAHGLGFAAYFWDFTAVPGYDYALYEADAGHASVVVDRLGYGVSGKPQGLLSCIGGQASVLHQVVQDLRHGRYRAGGAGAPAFSRVGLVGHSAGGELTEVEAESFHDVNAIGVMDWADQFFSPLAYTSFAVDGAGCALGGTAQGPGGPGGYNDFGATPADYDQVMFNAASNPAVVAAATAMRTKDPCGDILSILTGTAIDLVGGVQSINVPIAYVWGAQDALFLDALPWAGLQEALYLGSPRVTNIELPDSGHAVTLGPDSTMLERSMNGWLKSNGL
ncbi:MAG TPA: alpha/beta hydrolase [Solirubrobacteraceae bacterium]|jgi:hypothetical protein|nr:alpha/beta hydrolase [Solirubrobacteraceae bacterium]